MEPVTVRRNVRELGVVQQNGPVANSAKEFYFVILTNVKISAMKTNALHVAIQVSSHANVAMNEQKGHATTLSGNANGLVINHSLVATTNAKKYAILVPVGHAQILAYVLVRVVLTSAMYSVRMSWNLV